MGKKREEQIKMAKQYVADLEDKSNKWINPKPYFGCDQIDFDDEQPKIMTPEDVWKWTGRTQAFKYDDMNMLEKMDLETRKCFQPLVDELERGNDPSKSGLYIEYSRLLSLISKVNKMTPKIRTNFL